MDVFRTPDERFANLPGYPFAPHYCSVGQGLRLHYPDWGNEAAPPLIERAWASAARKDEMSSSG